MARIDYFDLEQASPSLKAIIGTRPPLNIYRMLAHAGPAAEGALSLGTGLLRENELDDRWRELVIVRVGILCGSDYEVHQHKRLAGKVGVAPEKLEALHDGPESPCFDDQEKAVLRYADQVVWNVKAGDSVFAAVERLLTPRALVELTLTIGYYMLISRLLENFEVDFEQQPPDLEQF